MRRTGVTPGRRQEYFTALLFMIPWILGFLIFTAYPLLSSLWLSLTNYRLFQSAEYAGLRNYVRMFTIDRSFSQAVSVTVRYVFVGVPMQLGFALLVALLLNRHGRGMAFFRAAFYVPSLLGGSVAIAMLWRLVFGSDGLFNQLLSTVGFQSISEISWYSDPRYNLGTLILLRVWQFGSPMIIFLAAMRQIPRSLYESAIIDGAGPVARFVRITLPFLTPVVLFNTVMQINSAFKTFAPAFIISDGTGGRLESLLFYTLYLYRAGFVEMRMGYASALAWVLVATIGTVSFLVFWSSNKWVYYHE